MLIFEIWLVVQKLSPLLYANFFNFGPNLPKFDKFDVKNLILITLYCTSIWRQVINFYNNRIFYDFESDKLYEKKKEGYEEERLNIVEKEGEIHRQRGAIWRCHCRSRSISFRDQCKCAGMFFFIINFHLRWY